MNLFFILDQLDFEILAIETGASAEYIELIVKEILPPNKTVLKLAKKRALTKLIEAQTNYCFKLFNN
mgnify:CR=1 FL=1